MSPPVADRPDESGTATPRPSSRILVVDDDQRNVRLMESILKTQGYPVLRAYDGEEALRIVEGEPPDLILLDVMMPKMSGFELCQRLKGRHETRLLPIIMVTALNALEDKVQALEIGADDFLSKPINKVELLAKVRAILRVKQLQDEVSRQASELERSNEALMRMQRFKDSMTQMVVHDLKNPLAGIMGNLQLMQIQRDEMTGVRLEELLQRTQESARQLMRMILNILHIGKLEEQKMPLRPESLALHELVQESVNEMASLSARDGIRLENRVDPQLPPLSADREMVGRVVANLLSNAFKHTPSGGTVTIEARREDEEIILTVCDTGEGIPEDLLPFIFDKFVAGQSDNSRRLLYDSGLGLTFCKLAVQSHGGRIWIESRLKQGTRVFVALPLHPAAGAEAPRAGASAA
jgi:two-component system, sensor histidine kinase and response regulator